MRSDQVRPWTQADEAPDAHDDAEAEKAAMLKEECLGKSKEVRPPSPVPRKGVLDTDGVSCESLKP